MKKILSVLGVLLLGAFSLSSGSSALAITDTTPPSTPTNLTATVISSSQINLAWTASIDNVGVTGYAIFRNGTEVADVATTTFNDIGLTASTTYAYTLQAFDAAGNHSTFTNTISTTTQPMISDTSAPSVPANLTATVISPSQINLAWTASTDNVGVTGYEIFRDGIQIATSTATNFNNLGLTASTTYTYNVKAFDAALNTSTSSNSVSATTFASGTTDTTAPSAPANLSATAVSKSQINLAWTAATDNIGVAGYKIFRNSNQVATSTGLTFHDTGLTASTTYAYFIQAFDFAGNISANSNSVSATTLSAGTSGDNTAPTAPTNLTAHVVSYKHVNLTWTASTDNKHVVGYIVYRDGVKIAKVKRPHYNSIRLTPGTTYTFTVQAIDKAGNLSAYSNTISVTTQPKIKPNKPENGNDNEHGKASKENKNDNKGKSNKD